MFPDNYLIHLQPEKDQPFFSEKQQIHIGRAPHPCDLGLSGDPAVSRSHAVIRFLEGRWYLEDLHSANGTFLNDQKLNPGTSYPLRSGDRIRLGNTTIDVIALRIPQEVPPVRNAGPAPGKNVFCRRCGMRVTGNFCPACGARVDSGVYIPMTPPSPSMAPMPPSPSIAPAPSRIPDPIPRTGDEAPSFFAPPSAGMAPPMPPSPSMAPPMPPAPSMAPSMAPAPSMARSSASSGHYASQKPAKKPGLLSKLFGGKQKSDAEAAPAPATFAPMPTASAAPAPAAEQPLDDVQFRGTAPKKLTPGEYFPVKIMMYREDDYQRADRESAMVAEETRSASSSVFQAARDQIFRITLQSPDIPVDCETQQLRWNGKFAAADFEVFLPEGFDRKQLRLRGRVYTGDAVLTDLKLILQVEAAAVQQPVCEKVRLRSAFISYASADRAKVVARIQGIQLACPDMDLFFDVESLRRGEHWEGRLYQEIASRDLFYLFWSSNAAASEWVRKELQFAVSRKTLDFIEPIPLEAPEVCAPPESLTSKHFNDWTLRYLSNS